MNPTCLVVVKTMTVITAHHAIPSTRPAAACWRPGGCRAFACAMDVQRRPDVRLVFVLLLVARVFLDAHPGLLLDCFLGLGAGTTGSSTSSASAEHAGFVVALHTCVHALLLPHRITAKVGRA